MDARPYLPTVLQPTLQLAQPQDLQPALQPALQQDLWSGLGMPSSGLVAFIGGGGKTTLMYRLAAEAASRGIAVVCTTTTRILPPRVPEDIPESSQPLILESDPVTLIDKLRHTASPCVAASHEDTGTSVSKLAGFAPETLDALARALPDRLFLVEADGAAMRPLKAPAPHEPVFPADTSLAIAVIGLEAMGLPLVTAQGHWAEHVHRPERVQALTRLLPGAPVDIDAIRTLVEHPQGLFQHCPPTARRVIFGNKADAAPPPEGWPWLYGSAHQGWCARKSSAQRASARKSSARRSSAGGNEA